METIRHWKDQEVGQNTSGSGQGDLFEEDQFYEEESDDSDDEDD